MSTVRIILSLVTVHTLPSLMENVIFFTISALAFVRLVVLEFKFPADDVENELYVSAPEADITCADDTKTVE